MILFLQEAARVEKLQIKLRQVLQGIPFDQAWKEFNARCARSVLRSEAVMCIFIQDISTNQWPSK